MPTWQLATILDDFNFSHAIRKTPGKKLKTRSQQIQNWKLKTELPNTCNQLIYNQIKVRSKKDSSTSCKLETISIKIGEVVWILQDLTPWGLWPIGRITRNKPTDYDQICVYFVKIGDKIVSTLAIRLAPRCPDYCNQAANEDSRQWEPHPKAALRRQP